MKRTHTCGELDKKAVGKEVLLQGWVDTRRDHGGIIFIDLRDRYGLTQVVFDPEHNKKAHKEAEKLRREFVIEAKGKVRPRKEGMANPNLKTGDIEVITDSLKIINTAEVPPIEIDDRIVAGDDVRMKYRYLDLRRPIMQNNIMRRALIMKAAREFFDDNGFIEITTPMLVKSTPEGARDYIVPSRVNPGMFYSTPQSPQLYKQILMIAGFDRYYQLPICLRDEDLRADRQPEHMQMDFEMSFVTSDDIREFVEGLMKHLCKRVHNMDIKDFPTFTYKEAVDMYGVDKPDIRFELKLTDVTDLVKKSDFTVFTSVIAGGGIVKCINPDKEFTRKELDAYIEFCQSFGAKGMAWLRVKKEGVESSITKYFKEDLLKEIVKKVGAKPGSTVMFVAGKPSMVNDVLARLRNKLGADLKLYDPKEFRFCWVKDFPLFAFNEDTETWEPEHHMFSMPKPEFVDDFEKRPGEVIGDLWDLVLNGVELGSGSIRVTVPSVQERIMKFIGLSKEKAHQKFGFLLDAYQYGAPNHGGMGLGLDRLIALMCGTNDIREVIAFPKNKAAQCLMDGCPSEVDEAQLKELNIKIDMPNKK